MKHLVLDDEVLQTEPAETRMSTRISPVYASTTNRSARGHFGFTFTSFMQESPRSAKSFSTLITLPKGDDEAIGIAEENSADSLETPTEIMQRRVNESIE